MKKSRLVATFGTALVLTLAVSASASAATYEVHACRLPSGAPAPANGWTTYGQRAVSQIRCPGGAMTSTSADGQHSAGSLLGFAFAAPTGQRSLVTSDMPTAR